MSLVRLSLSKVGLGSERVETDEGEKDETLDVEWEMRDVRRGGRTRRIRIRVQHDKEIRLVNTKIWALFSTAQFASSPFYLACELSHPFKEDGELIETVMNWRINLSERTSFPLENDRKATLVPNEFVNSAKVGVRTEGDDGVELEKVFKDRALENALQ